MVTIYMMNELKKQRSHVLSADFSRKSPTNDTGSSGRSRAHAAKAADNCGYSFSSKYCFRLMESTGSGIDLGLVEIFILSPAS